MTYAKGGMSENDDFMVQWDRMMEEENRKRNDAEGKYAKLQERVFFSVAYVIMAIWGILGMESGF